MENFVDISEPQDTFLKKLIRKINSISSLSILFTLSLKLIEITIPKLTADFYGPKWGTWGSEMFTEFSILVAQAEEAESCRESLLRGW